MPLDNYERIVAIIALSLIGAAAVGAALYSLIQWLRSR